LEPMQTFEAPADVSRYHLARRALDHERYHGRPVQIARIGTCTDDAGNDGDASVAGDDGVRIRGPKQALEASLGHSPHAAIRNVHVGVSDVDSVRPANMRDAPGLTMSPA